MWRYAGIIAGCLDRLASELKLAPTGVKREFSLADPNYGSLVPYSIYVRGVCHHCHPPLFFFPVYDTALFVILDLVIGVPQLPQHGPGVFTSKRRWSSFAFGC